MSKKRIIKIVASLIVFTLVIVFCLWVLNIVTASPEFTEEQRESLLSNFAPLQMLLFAVTGFGTALLVDRFLKRRNLGKSEMLTRMIRYFAAVFAIILVLVLMLTNSILYFVVPGIIFLAVIVEFFGRKLVKE